MDLSVSILSSSSKSKMIKILNDSCVSYIHMDVMDGKFVKEKSLSSFEFIRLARISKKKLDVHLMVEDPIKYIDKIKKCKNIEYITIHYEINSDIKGVLLKIKEYGFKCGLAISPDTDPSCLLPYINLVDLILLMTVYPGYGGQKFLDISTNRLKEIKKIVPENIKLEVDGGINNETIKLVKEADIFVVGSFITKSCNPLLKIDELIHK